MSVFRNYNSQKAGNVNSNAFPNVYPYGWDPIQRNIRSNPNIPSQPQRVQPHERGTFFPTSATSGGTLAANISSDCGCGGSCSGGNNQVVTEHPPTASSKLTGNNYPGKVTSASTRIMSPIKVQPRMTASLRGTFPGTIRGSRQAPKLMGASFMGGRGVR